MVNLLLLCQKKLSDALRSVKRVTFAKFCRREFCPKMATQKFPSGRFRQKRLRRNAVRGMLNLKISSTKKIDSVDSKFDRLFTLFSSKSGATSPDSHRDESSGDESHSARDDVLSLHDKVTKLI